jgi:hypothetical protein
MSHHRAEHRDPALNECIDHCTQCHAVCLETINYCLSRGGQHSDPDHIALMATCADICATSANAMLRGASIHTVICGACAEVCNECAEECEEMGEDDPEMQRCAEICRQCADSCEAMTEAEA